MVSEQVQHKTNCTSTEDGSRTEILGLESYWDADLHLKLDLESYWDADLRLWFHMQIVGFSHELAHTNVLVKLPYEL